MSQNRINEIKERLGSVPLYLRNERDEHICHMYFREACSHLLTLLEEERQRYCDLAKAAGEQIADLKKEKSELETVLKVNSDLVKNYGEQLQNSNAELSRLREALNQIYQKAGEAPYKNYVIDASDYAKMEAALSPKAQEPESKYPCAKCGTLRTKEEGGTVFTVCDKCWDAAPSGPKENL